MLNTAINQEIKRGDIWLANLGEGVGSIQGKLRPVVIVQNNMGNQYSPTLTCIPLTSQNKKQLPTHVLLKNTTCLLSLSIALCEQITTLSKGMLSRYIGEVSSVDMQEIERAIKIQTGIKDDLDISSICNFINESSNIKMIVDIFKVLKEKYNLLKIS
jgi:mRNA-degrading endonuclease toxin of MazEF toxin-antitoxin module